MESRSCRDMNGSTISKLGITEPSMRCDLQTIVLSEIQPMQCSSGVPTRSGSFEGLGNDGNFELNAETPSTSKYPNTDVPHLAKRLTSGDVNLVMSKDRMVSRRARPQSLNRSKESQNLNLQPGITPQPMSMYLPGEKQHVDTRRTSGATKFRSPAV